MSPTFDFLRLSTLVRCSWYTLRCVHGWVIGWNVINAPFPSEDCSWKIEILSRFSVDKPRTWWNIHSSKLMKYVTVAFESVLVINASSVPHSTLYRISFTIIVIITAPLVLRWLQIFLKSFNNCVNGQMADFDIIWLNAGLVSLGRHIKSIMPRHCYCRDWARFEETLNYSNLPLDKAALQISKICKIGQIRDDIKNLKFR